MNINQAFPGTYLKASDLQGRTINIAMHSVVIEDVGRNDRKPVLYFMDRNGTKREQGLVLNKTNANVIAEMYGPETDMWPGNVITIHPARVEFQGQLVDAIRVKLEAPQQQHQQAPLPMQQQSPLPPQQSPPQANGAMNSYAQARSGAQQYPNAAPHQDTIIDDEIPF